MRKSRNERNSKLVLELKDKKGLSFGQIGKIIGRSKSTVFVIYTNEKERSGK